MVNIKGLDKAKVLMALYNHSHVQGLGFLSAQSVVTLDDCKKALEDGNGYIDYLFGRVIKVDLSGDEFDERLYDRDCGAGSAALAVAALKR